MDYNGDGLDDFLVPYSGTTEQVIFAHLQRPAPRLAERNVQQLHSQP